MLKSLSNSFSKIIFGLTLFLSGLASAQTTYPINPNQDILDYTFNISLSNNSHKINGEAIISFTMKEQDKLILDLIGLASDGKGMVVDKISAGGIAVPFNHQHNRLIISLDEKPDSAVPYEITIHYHGVPAAGLVMGDSKFGEPVFFGDNYPDRARNWLPCVDHPADKAMVTWVITAPGNFKVVASGKLVSETESGENTVTTWDEQVPISTKVMTFGAANFAVDQSGRVRDVPVTTWVYQQNKAAGFYDFSIAPKVLAYYDSLIGPYPYEKLANVQSKTTYGGMENAGNIFYYENSVNGLGKIENLIAHEIVHQWFGNSATEKDWPHAWLSEGFATYLTHVYVGSRYGIEKMKQGLIADRDRVIRYWQQNHLPIVNYDLVTYPQVSGPLLSTNTYQKAGWVLHMLRNELGDNLFWQSIRKYYTDYRDSIAGTSDFQKVVEEVSGKDLQPFFNQWLYGEGQPVLEGGWQYANNKVMVKLTQIQKKPFTFPLEIGLVYGKEIIVKSVNITSSVSSFNFSSSRPVRVIIDPNTKLLFEGDRYLKSQ
jgi:aminopeptidase N